MIVDNRFTLACILFGLAFGAVAPSYLRRVLDGEVGVSPPDM